MRLPIERQRKEYKTSEIWLNLGVLEAGTNSQIENQMQTMIIQINVSMLSPIHVPVKQANFYLLFCHL